MDASGRVTILRDASAWLLILNASTVIFEGFQGTPKDLLFSAAPSKKLQGTYLFFMPLQKTLKSTVFELEWWFLHVNRSVFHQELNRKGPRVHGSHIFTKKWQISYPNFQHQKIPKKLDLGFDMSLTHDMTFLAFVLS